MFAWSAKIPSHRKFVPDFSACELDKMLIKQEISRYFSGLFQTELHLLVKMKLGHLGTKVRAAGLSEYRKGGARVGFRADP